MDFLIFLYIIREVHMNGQVGTMIPQALQSFYFICGNKHLNNFVSVDGRELYESTYAMNKYFSV